MKLISLSLRTLFSICIICLHVFTAQAQTTEESLRQKAAAYIISNKKDSALYFSNRLAEQFPSTENFLVKGSVHEIRGELRQADAAYVRALSMAGDDAYKVYADLGAIALRRNDTVQAISYTVQSLRLNNRQPDIHYFLANLYGVSNKPDSAFHHQARAYELDSINIEYIKRMYRVQYENGNIAEAIRLLEKAAAMDTTDLDIKRMLASSLLETDQFSKTLDVERSIPTDSLRHSDHFIAARSHLHLNDTTEAIHALQNAITAARDTLQPLYYDELVQVYASLGQYRHMLDVYVKGEAAGIGDYKLWLDEYRLAADTIKTIYDNLPNSDLLTSLSHLGRLYVSVRDYVSALKVFNDYKEAEGKMTDSIYALISIANFLLKRYSEARTAIENALQISPGNEDYKALHLSILYQMRDHRGVIANAGRQDQLRTLKQDKKANDLSDISEYFLFKSYYALGDLKQASLHHRAFMRVRN